MREFEFMPGIGPEKWDTKSDSVAAVWSINDLQNAMEAHAKSYNAKRTLAIFTECTGLDPTKQNVMHLPRRFFAPLIAWYCNEITTRPHRMIIHDTRRDLA
jgi:hypothetical protein